MHTTKDRRCAPSDPCGFCSVLVLNGGWDGMGWDAEECVVLVVLVGCWSFVHRSLELNAVHVVVVFVLMGRDIARFYIVIADEGIQITTYLPNLPTYLTYLPSVTNMLSDSCNAMLIF